MKLGSEGSSFRGQWWPGAWGRLGGVYLARALDKAKTLNSYLTWHVGEESLWRAALAPWNGPSSVDAMLKELEWEVSGRPSPPANKSRPWIFYGRPGGSVNAVAIFLATGSVASAASRFNGLWRLRWNAQSVLVETITGTIIGSAGLVLLLLQICCSGGSLATCGLWPGNLSHLEIVGSCFSGMSCWGQQKVGPAELACWIPNQRICLVALALSFLFFATRVHVGRGCIHLEEQFSRSTPLRCTLNRNVIRVGAV